eukprot:TRINITY_DN21876_c0_g1_i1.p1 TRINITY_DN21876_c0_g1~~TRINITY_DN21876_c0_g1_i1.p1  ORF type:complete len:361 (-),score=59.45 TRINITY_DN21876_c0_g1_i1:355-1437(-)
MGCGASKPPDAHMDASEGAPSNVPVVSGSASAGDIEERPTGDVSVSQAPVVSDVTEAVHVDDAGVSDAEADNFAEIVEGEVLQTQTMSGAQSWAAVRRVFGGSGDGTRPVSASPPADLCGLSVSHQPMESGGYAVRIENRDSLARIIRAAAAFDRELAAGSIVADLDFSKSKNLRLADHSHLTTVAVTSPLHCTVYVPPHDVMVLKLEPVNAEEDQNIVVDAVPGAQTQAKTLKTGVVFHTAILSECKGFDISVDNPTDKSLHYMFDFAKSVNMVLAQHPLGAHAAVEIPDLHAGGSPGSPSSGDGRPRDHNLAVAGGMRVIARLEPGTRGVPLCGLRRVAFGAVRLTYAVGKAPPRAAA